MSRQELHLELGQDVSLAAHLAQAAALSVREVKDAMRKGAVWVSRGPRTTRARRAGARGRAGEVAHLYYDPRVLAEVPPAPTLVHDAGDHSLWAKPYGLRSQGSRWGDHCTLEREAQRLLGAERAVFTVHRLDRAAHGLMLLAHGKRAAAALGACFRERRVEKRYRVVVRGELETPDGELLLDSPLDGRAARSWVRRLGFDATRGWSLAEVRLETGRKHQIRRHLAALGHPVVGDRLHGDGDEGAPDLQLCAWELAFDWPPDPTPRRYVLPQALCALEFSPPEA